MCVSETYIFPRDFLAHLVGSHSLLHIDDQVVFFSFQQLQLCLFQCQAGRTRQVTFTVGSIHTSQRDDFALACRSATPNRTNGGKIKNTFSLGYASWWVKSAKNWPRKAHVSKKRRVLDDTLIVAAPRGRVGYLQERPAEGGKYKSFSHRTSPRCRSTSVVLACVSAEDLLSASFKQAFSLRQRRQPAREYNTATMSPDEFTALY